MPDHLSPSGRRLKNPKEIAKYEAATADGLWDLASLEIWWRDRQHLLEKHGYLLRPRFRPGWTPSWRGTDLNPFGCEDSIEHNRREVIDACRMSDSTTVIIKRVASGSGEIYVAQYLTSPERLQDPSNRCVPILDVFQDEAEPDFDFMVMPLLREFDDPPFVSVREVADFMLQTLEGLDFIHRQDVAHRDCSTGNIMMDGTPLCPEGFHPTHPWMIPSNEREAKVLRRTDVSSVKYYIIDFGISSHFDEPSLPRLVCGQDGQDQEVPELSPSEDYNPFPVDIFTLGNVFRKKFIKEYSNFNFLIPLVESMTQEDPSARPTSADALAQFKSLLAPKSGYTLRWRLQAVDEHPVSRLFRDAIHVVKLIASNKKSPKLPLTRPTTS